MNTRIVRTVGFALLALGAGCDRKTSPVEPSIDAELRQSIGGWGVVPIGPMPVQNPSLVDLGRALMFDKILSGNRDVACATCHHPSTSAGDGLSLSIGTGGTGLGPSRALGPGRHFIARNAPSLLNGGIGLFYMFWDGRVSGFHGGPFTTPAGAALPPDLPNVLAALAMFPVLDRNEMRGQSGDRDVFGNPNELAAFGDSELPQIWSALMARLLAIPEYVTKFTAAFPGTPVAQLGFQHAATAIAAFQMQALVKTNSPFDRYLGRDDAALTAQQKRGALLFFGKALCSSCHNGPFLGGQGFANAGVPQIGPGTGAAAPLDPGRGGAFDEPFYRFAFRISPLRNVALTAPYGHDGAFATLEAVVRHYNDVPKALETYDPSQLAPAVRGQYHGDAATIDSVLATLDFRLRTPLGLTDQEQGDLVAFLESLTDPAAQDLSALIPATVPSGLPVPR